MSILPDGLPDEEGRKAAAHGQLTVHRARYVRAAQRALLAHLLAHDTGTIDHVHAAVPVPDGIDPKLFGAVPGPLADAGLIRAAGYVKTARAVGRARPVTVWALADRAAAAAWLTAYPEMPDLDRGEEVFP